jgi:crossover junction endodeoxyribonuclease RuvC
VTKVVGLDLSLTSTGVAVFSAHNGAGWPIDTTDYRTIGSKGKRGDSVQQRRGRINAIVREIRDLAESADLAVVEGPSIMSKGGSNWDRAGLWWGVVDTLGDDGIPVAVAAPTVVKKFATGRGNADKAAVAASLARLLHLWPDFNDGMSNDLWDAVALALMGAQRLGFDVEYRAHQAAVLESVEWPETLRAAA